LSHTSRARDTDTRTRTIDAMGMRDRAMNSLLRSMVSEGASRIRLVNVFGQRYIATNLAGRVEIDIEGTPGNDLGAFMDGPTVTVHGNVQDGCGNTMNSGAIIVHGRAGDIAGLSMRGGSMLIRDDIGYRGAIHMKAYGDQTPLLVVGGTAQDFFGEYMAGGTAVLLGLTGKPHRARFIGTGMHGGVIYVRGEVQSYQLGKEVAVLQPDAEDLALIEEAVSAYAGCFSASAREILSARFVKLSPVSTRPYGTLYTY